MTHVDLSPAAAVRRIARHSPARVAIVYEGRSIRYAELADAAGRLAVVLAGAGMGRGDRVAYLGLNSPAFLVTELAAAWFGGVFVPVNSRLAAAEVRQVLADSGARTVVAEPGHQQVADVAAADLGLRRLLVDDDPADPPPAGIPPGWVGLGSALAAASPPPEPVPCHQDDLAQLVYTSGTTGRAKGVRLTHGNLWWNGVNLDTAAGMTADDVNLVVAPLFHTAPLGCFTLRSLTRGGTSVVRRSFDASEALADLVEHRVNTVFAVPAMYRAIARTPGFAGADLSALRAAVTAGAPAPPPLIAEYADRGVALQNAYGLTEVLFATCLPAARVREKLGSAGVVLPYTKVEVLAAPGEPGEVCIKGPTVTPGYWNDPEATARAFRPGSWFRTGDAGYVDEEGCLFIVDRLKDMVIVGGDNVYSGEVERVLGDHPGVADVAVVGTPDEASGEAVVAVVTGDGTPSLGELREFARARLAAYKLPTRLLVTEAMPRNVMGKIDKNALRARLRAGTERVEVDRAGAGPSWAQRAAALSGAARQRLAVDLVGGHIAELSAQPGAAIMEDVRLQDLNLSSLAAADLSSRLSAETGVRLPVTLVFDHPTVGALARYLSESVADPADVPKDAALAPVEAGVALDTASDEELFGLIDGERQGCGR